MIDKIRRLVELIAARGCEALDDPEFMADDYAGGNIDDACEVGRDMGRVDLARQIIKLLNEGA